MLKPETEPEFVAGTLRTRRQLRVRGGAFLLAGLAIIVVGLVLPVPGMTSLLFVLVGAVVTYLGAARLLWAARGRKVDLLVWLCGTWLVVLILAALFAPVLPLGEPSNVADTLTVTPYLPPFESGSHILGTNAYGLDLLARMVYGARSSLSIALMAVAISLVVGGILGVLAGFYRRGIESVIGIVTNALLAVPALILLIVMVSILDPNVRNIAIALSLLSTPTMVRLARAHTIAYNQRGFVLAARSLGASRWRLITRELVPSVLPPLLSMSMVLISVLIVAEASLSFLGLGIPIPAATWGNMISEAQASETTMIDYPSILLVPGIALFLTVFSFNLIGERAQKKWDPRGAKL